MAETRNHHFISQFYLRGFTKSGGSKEKLYVFDKIQNKFFIASPRNIGSKRDFNRISFEGKENYLEEELSKMEHSISLSFKKIITTKKYPNQEDLANIVQFIGLVALRNPKMRNIYNGFHIDVLEKMASLIVSSEDIYKYHNPLHVKLKQTSQHLQHSVLGGLHCSRGLL